MVLALVDWGSKGLIPITNFVGGVLRYSLSWFGYFE